MRGFVIISLLFVFAGSFAQQTLDTTLLPNDEKVALARIEAYRQRVLKGESMSDIAKLYTEDPGSVSSGGAYYGIKKGMFVPEFEAAATALKPGDISEVFKTAYGFHFVQLISRRDDAMDVRHVLITPKSNPK